MKHLQKILRETATVGSTSAGGVAGVRGRLFSKPIKREKVKSLKVHKIAFHNDARDLRESFLKEILQEAKNGQFKAIDIISKLKAAERRHDFEKDAIAFGVEDDQGNTVKVYVRANQAEQFEKTLAEILDDNTDDSQDLAEVLFNLKDKFEIVHVEWGKVEEDEEELELPDESKPEGEKELSLDDETEGDDTADAENMDDLESEDETGAESVLDKVISMLKAEAEARAAEARAKEAEAEAKEAEYAAKAAEAKIKGEEEILDMEAYFKQQNEEKKEAQKLARLARYRHEKAADMDDSDIDVTSNVLSREDL